MYEINSRIERPDPALIEQVKDLYYCMVGVCVGPRYVMSPMGLDQAFSDLVCNSALLFSVRQGQPKHGCAGPSAYAERL